MGGAAAQVWRKVGYHISMRHGQPLFSEGSGSMCFYILVAGRMLCDPVPWPAGGGVPAPPLEPGR